MNHSPTNKIIGFNHKVISDEKNENENLQKFYDGILK
jgi:hypothetical protein